ncbi:MAG: endolytic transglycosylase MltG [Deltaproteobacteria bacterium]|nr:endolytic transglycosylase MltG [Deltaproteobacteria bacterium]
MHVSRDIRIASLFFGLSIITFFFALISVPSSLNEDDKVTVVLRMGLGVYDIAKLLEEKELINSKYLFVFTSFLFGSKLFAGEYELSKDMSILEIVDTLRKGKRKIYVVKIIEGSDIFQCARMLEENLNIKKEDFLKLAKDKNFLKELNIQSPSLEGYLFPDTYYYSKEIAFEDLIRRIVQRRLRYFQDERIKKRMQDLGLGIHEILTLASLIEKEAKIEKEKPLISAVFHNRLKLNMPLECDPTVLYGIEKKGPITKTDLKRKTEYNTYTFRGLPPGPICNPSTSSIDAAIFPADVDYLYFVAKNDGTHVFSKDLKEHERYVSIYQGKGYKNLN